MRHKSTIKKKAETFRDLVDNISPDKSTFKAFSFLHKGTVQHITYGELQSSVRQLAAGLLRAGARKQMPIGILSENRIEWVITYLAIGSIGAIIVPIDISLGKDEILEVVKSTHTKLMFTSEAFLEKTRFVEDKATSLRKVVCFDPQTLLAGNLQQQITDLARQESKKKLPFRNHTFLAYQCLRSVGEDALSHDIIPDNSSEPSPHDSLVYVYMSEGQVAVLSQQALLSNMHGLNNSSANNQMFAEPQKICLATLPLHHTFPAMSAILVVLSCYAHTMIVNTLRVKEIIRAIQDHQVNYLPTVPLMLEKILIEVTKKNIKFVSLDFIAVGAAPVLHKIISAFEQLGVSVIQGYGLSEYSPVISITSREENRIGSAGRPIPGVSLAIGQADSDGEGEILVKGPSMMTGYLKNPKMTKQVIDADGWLHTGDMGYLDEDGFLFITGRKKQVIVTKGGKNIYPAEIEKVLQMSKHIAKAQVVPRLDPRKGEYAHAIIEPTRKQDAELSGITGRDAVGSDSNDFIFKEIRRLFKPHAAYKMPGDFEIVSTLDKSSITGALFRFGNFYKESAPQNLPTRKEASNADDNSYQPETIEHLLLTMVGKRLAVNIDAINLSASIIATLSSLELVELSTELEEMLGISLQPTILFEHSTIKELADYIYLEHGDVLAKRNRRFLSPATNPLGTKHQSESQWRPGVRTRLSPLATTHHPGNNAGIAVIGVGCTFPGAQDAETFWDNLLEGKSLVSEIPPDRWDWRAYMGNPLLESNKTDSKWGGFIDDVDKFDAAFFGISPAEAVLMDPQQRLFLQTVWRTIEDAAIKPTSLSGSRTGLFVGVSTSDYQELASQSEKNVTPYLLTGNAHSILANRISYLMNWHGPSEAIDTACSSSLVAIDRAIEAITSNKCDVAIAGGANLILSPRLFVALDRACMLSKSGQCRTFDQGADGYVRGEGTGAVLLKPLAMAKKDGDHIYAVIRATAVNHNGKTNTLTSPCPRAQEALICEAVHKATVDPRTIGYIEAHGTGTKLGDPIEMNGLKMAFARLFGEMETEEEDQCIIPRCGIGSVKTNIGHLEAASGIAGLIKTIMALKHKKLPATLHYSKQNQYIELDGSHLYIVDKTSDWPCFTGRDNKPIPRRAGVSSFGFGGTNAHVIIEEYGDGEPEKTDNESSPRLILLSARNREILREYAGRLASFVINRCDVEPKDACRVNAGKAAVSTLNTLANVAYTLQVGREEMEERFAFVARDFAELAEILCRYQKGETKGIGGACYGNTNPSEASMRIFLDDPNSERFVESLLQHRRLDTLAALWVMGARFDWGRLYRKQIPCRISLPGYPFDKKRFWFETNEQPRPVTAQLNHQEPLAVAAANLKKISLG